MLNLINQSEPIARFETPFNPNLSKNRRYVGRYSKVLSHTHKKAREEVELACKRAICDIKPLDKKQRLLVCVMVYKPSNACDAHNMLDDSLDAIEKAIGVNDRYYSSICHYEIDKLNPRLEFTLYKLCTNN
jgi:hypothetical protein